MKTENFIDLAPWAVHLK